ncbi:hypothetical protein [Gordonia oryzae]|uniref:hypothetical protein n=1 Tax=Gordonia oryzae TaxID=2487349 RepID=UPI001FE29F70|nr:hypothetical protein [Gordonia oryzae]
MTETNDFGRYPARDSANSARAWMLLWLVISRRGAGYSAAFTSHIDPGSMGLNIVVAVRAFVGFASTTTLSAESRRPFRSVPRILIWPPP